ncbi:hypothetical protein P170DRAFT_358230 [Aspergillus steynii IBT 23096]|uniref:Uncharacterized protein n=1 Tax=Aspergillus steynii IBT 23096 TaxID=1392250 RepID=A0A2I2G750_9EURO|nr:uncharacterized protein P170DRAFT_358230 [Aspergillus steynii IBT 23096]PLB48691.1 hypothetical protein P170DRAFT_358230 [Aspergillus steynii IBT 23096]
MTETLRDALCGPGLSDGTGLHGNRDLRGETANDALPIAVIGIAFKLPQGIESVDSLWETLSAGRSAWSPFPPSRLNPTGIYDPDDERLNSFPLKGAHFINGDLGAFDAPFFKIGPAEAAEIDPQSRILLETTYHALENGYILANRISWFFDLHGASIHVGTACSSALVAIHAACQGIRAGESDLAIVAGVNLLINPDMAMFLNNQNFLSPDGRSWSFDQSANGYGRGEGFGVIILKSVDGALRDHDTIRAVVRATGINQDGHTPGIVQPSRTAQADLIRQTYQKAGLDMKDTRYIESHGTGTPVGDPIEAGAISDAFGSSIPLYVGSVKANIGHLEDASAIASVIKSVLVLEQGEIPPIAGLEVVNPAIAVEHPNLQFPKTTVRWPSKGLRRLSINSFGFGGTNAHIVMEDAENHLKSRGITASTSKTSSDRLEDPKLLVFSAQDEGGIGRLQSAYNQYHAVGPYPSNQDYVGQLAYTLSERRSTLLWRSFVTCASLNSLTQGLKLSTPVKALVAPKLALCFTGQGAQWYSMGRELRIYDSYREALSVSATTLKSIGCEWNLLDELSRAPNESRINDPEISQTLCTAVQIGLVDLLEAVGVKATVVIGHSSGEIAAAYSVGFLDKRSAIRVAYYRGLLASLLVSGNTHEGAMLAAGASDSQIQPYLDAVGMQHGKKGITVGCINSPRSVTVTGDLQQIECLKRLLDADGIFARKLAVPVAYHSSHMEAIAKRYYDSLDSLTGRPGSLATVMISSVTGEPVTSREVCQRRYWVDNMVSPVRFAKALSRAGSLRVIGDKTSPHEVSRPQFLFQDILEIGPHSTLRRQIEDTLAAGPAKGPAPGYSSAFRQAPRHDFLGIRVPDWNPYQAKWRRRIRISEDPWLQGHVVSRANILPGAAVIAMAIEGVRSLLSVSPAPDKLAVYKLKDIQFFRPVGISADTDGVEVEFYICSTGQTTDRDDGWREFHMYCIDNAAWTEACRGQIRVVYMRDSGHVDSNIQTKLEAEDHAAELARVQATCSRTVKMDQFYNRLAADGIMFGPAHQAVKQTAYNDHLECWGHIDLLSWTTNSRKLSQTDFVIHPASLDGLFHLGLIPVTDGGKKVFPCVMIGIQQMWISEKVRDHNSIVAWNKSSLTGLDKTTSNVVALDFSGHETLFSASGLDAKFIRGASVASQDSRRLCWNFDTRPDIELLAPEELRQYSFGVETEPHMTDDVFFNDLLARVESQDVRGSFFAVIARNLDDILKGKSDALHLMFHSSLVKDYYRAHNKMNNGLLKSLVFLDLYAHKNPRMRVLEIGAGTGGMTKYVLDTLTQDGSGISGAGNPRFSHYTYTDISAGFFPAAESLFDSLKDRVTFQVLDIEKNPVAQGFELGVYDMIIAENVLHATQDLDTTLKHVRELLKPEGKLLLLELTIPEAIRTGFAFGLLPGWWRFKDAHREFSALVSAEVWHSLLLKAGFSGVELELTDYDDPVHHEYSAIISTAVVDDGSPKLHPPRTAIVLDESDPVQISVAQTLSQRIKNMAAPETTVTRLSDAARLAGQGTWLFIIIVELGDSFMSRMTESSFAHLKQIFLAADGLLWVCRGGGSRPQLPDHAMIQGAFRGLRLEKNASKFITLSLEAATLDSAWIASKTLKVFQDVVTKPVDECEQEYVERDGSLCVDRLIEGGYLNRQLPALAVETENGERAFGDCDSLRLEITTPGLLDTLQFVADKNIHEPLGADEIEIQVEASGVNFRDCLTALGRIPGDILGLDCSGTVTRRGDTVTDLAVGDRVFAGALGTYQTYTRCKASHAIPIPDSMSFSEAAALPVVLNTAFYALVHVANIQPRETVLIHSAAGGTGQAAIQVSRLRKAEIFATVGSEEKKTLLMNLYQISEDHIFDSRSTSFVKGIQRMTSGRGVDVILNSLSGDLLVESWQCMAPFGRFLELGKKDILENGSLPMRPFARNASFHAIDLIAHLDRPEFLRRLRSDIEPLIAQGKLRAPQPLHVYGVAEIEKAFRYLQGGQNTGKTVIEMRQKDVVKNKVFENMTFRDWKQAVDSKVAGSWHLHRLLPKNMDFFIMYSSFAGAIGGTASVNYSAACAFQDALVHHRNSLGERATTFNLGLMLEDGVLRDNDTNFVTRGTEVPIIMKRPLLSGTWNIQDAEDTQAASTGANGPVDVVQQLAGIRSVEKAADVIAESLMHRLGKALGVPVKNLDLSKPLNGYGVDSLIAVELRNWCQAKLDADVPVFDILANKSFSEIGSLAAGSSKVVARMLEGFKDG